MNLFFLPFLFLFFFFFFFFYLPLPSLFSRNHISSFAAIAAALLSRGRIAVSDQQAQKGTLALAVSFEFLLARLTVYVTLD